MLLFSSKCPPAKVVVVGGEADEIQLRRLESVWKDREVFFAKNLPLPTLAALFEMLTVCRTRQRNLSCGGGDRGTLRFAFRSKRSGDLGTAE